jgi:hypothetical protein
MLKEESLKGRCSRVDDRRQKCTNGLCGRDLQDIQQNLQKTMVLEIEKQLVGSFTRLKEVSDWTIWRGCPSLNEIRGVRNTALGKEEIEVCL